MKRPDELSGPSPLASVVQAWRCFAEQEPYFPKVPARQADLIMAVQGAIIHDPWVRTVALPMIQAHRVMDEPGDKQANARKAIKILGDCQDRALAERCIKWLRTNHHV